MAIQGRLATKDRLYSWEGINLIVCVFSAMLVQKAMIICFPSVLSLVKKLICHWHMRLIGLVFTELVIYKAPTLQIGRRMPVLGHGHAGVMV